MKGHEQVIAMRMARARPANVHLQVDEEAPPPWPAPSDCVDRFPYVYIAPGEAMERLDLRFLVGLQVIVTAPTYPRMVEAFYACKAAGAHHVLAVTYDEQTRTAGNLTEWRNDDGESGRPDASGR